MRKNIVNLLKSIANNKLERTRVAPLSICFICIFAILFLGGKNAYAVDLKEMKSFEDWSVFVSTYKYSDNSCYAISTPYRTRAFKGLRNLPYITIKHQGYDQFSLSITPGYRMDKRKGLVINANNRYHLLSQQSNEFAWTSSYVQDNSILRDLLRDGNYFTTRAYSYSDETSLDYYSLRGLSDALTFMNKACGKHEDSSTRKHNNHHRRGPGSLY